MNGDGAYRSPPAPKLEECPHCRAQSVTVAHEGLRWTCGVCGGARIPGVDKLEERTVKSLARARTELRRAGRARFVWLLAGAPMLIFLTAAGTTPLGMLAFVALGGLILWLTTRHGPDQARRSAWDALDEAWADVAVRFASPQDGTLTAVHLAKVTQISEEDAEKILTKLSVRGARVILDDEGELHYRIDTRELAPLSDASEPVAAAKRDP